MQAFVVAVEYRGPDVGACGEGTRVGTREHAFDVESATLIAHLPGFTPRVAFPARQRAWNSEPEFARCPRCEAVVTSVVRAIIRSALAAVRHDVGRGRTSS
jgi:hypothetical protein